MKKLYLSLLFSILLTSFSFAQIVHINGPSGSEDFGRRVINLDNGNFIVADPLYDEAGIENIGAVYVYDGKTHQIIASVKGSHSNDYVGKAVYLVAPNTVLLHILDYNGGRGAVTLLSPEEGKHIKVDSSNSLVGIEPNDFLNTFWSKDPSGKYVLLGFPYWNDSRGALISHLLSQPLSGTISSNDAFVGTNSYDFFASRIYFKNEYIIARSSGAFTVLTWDNCKGEISPFNSLVGEYNDMSDMTVTFLKDGKSLVVNYPRWNNNRGAVTFIDLANPTVGTISPENSLVGESIGDRIGEIPYLSGIYALENNNYAVVSREFNQKRGAITWGDGKTGVKGVVSSNNSFIGEKSGDYVGYGLTPLPNGNYVISSPGWNNGRGALTWADGSKKLTGTISNANSLVGKNENDQVGKSIINLSNGDYCIVDINDGSERQLTITWVSGEKGINGYFTPENSLIIPIPNMVSGSSLAFTPLGNGNGLITQPYWNDGRGAVIFITKGNYPTGFISSRNSLVGTEPNDRIGEGKLVVLANNNFVIQSPSWNSRKGAITWGDGKRGVSGEVSAQNSIIGLDSRSYILGGPEVIALTNGNFVAHTNPLYNQSQGATIFGGTGTLIWGNGTTGTFGEITSANSLQIPDLTILSATALKNGNYAVVSSQRVLNYSALTIMDGSKPISTTISKENSLISNSPILSPISSSFYFLNNSSDFLFHNHAARSVTFVDGSKSIIGEVTDKNSIIGISTEIYDMTPTYNYTLKSMIVGRPLVNMVSIFKTEVVTGLDEIQETLEKQTILYPNPSSTFSALRSKKENREVVTVKVVDQLGQVLFLQSGQISKHISLDLMTQSLKPGTYHLEVTGPNYVEKHRLVKQ